MTLPLFFLLLVWRLLVLHISSITCMCPDGAPISDVNSHWEVIVRPEGTSLVVPWLRLCTSNAGWGGGVTGLIPGWGT